jgi:arabinose-5-phosphate isomerase
VWGAVEIAQALGVSDLIIGLTIVALGTSLPELAASVVSALKGEPDIAIGNVIGSNLFNLLAVLGIPGLISPLLIDSAVLTRDYPVMIGLTVAFFLMAYGIRGPGRINRLEGGLLLACYVGYQTLLYFSTRGGPAGPIEDQQQASDHAGRLQRQEREMRRLRQGDPAGPAGAARRGGRDRDHRGRQGERRRPRARPRATVRQTRRTGLSRGRMNEQKLQALGLAVIETEACAVSALAARIDARFAQACGYMLACEGRVVVIGMGKSGHIGSKIAATLASTGTPAFFVHPGEASHGDLGMITPKDVVVALSNSGETAELLTILPLIKRLGVPLISMTGKANSTLARAANVNLDVSVEKEACPLGLAPTSSTTVALVMGDALAVALLESRGFTAEDFARAHPGGSLGRRLLLLIDDIMHTGDTIPQVGLDAPLTETLHEMTRKGLGMTAVLDARRPRRRRIHRRRPQACRGPRDQSAQDTGR